MTPLEQFEGNGRFEALLYCVYGDESHDEKCRRIFSVSGLFGSEQDWDLVKAIWVARTGGKPFHAADCESDRGDYEGIPHEENLRLYADLTKILARSSLMGIVVSMNLREYEEVIRPAPGDVQQPYYLCFIGVVATCAKWGLLSVPADRVKFTFETNLDVQFNAGLLYSFMAKDFGSEWHNYLFDKIAFVVRKESGVQAADLLAREGMKLLENQMTIGNRRSSRVSLQALLSTKRFRFVNLRRSYFKKLAMPVVSLPGMPPYNQWILQQGLQDSTTNQTRYACERLRRFYASGGRH